MTNFSWRFAIISLFSAIFLSSVPARATLLTTNGNFEAGGGSLDGWTVTDQAGGSGSWYLQTGTSSPSTGASVPAPPDGANAAMTDQTGPGSHALTQNFTIPFDVASSVLLTFDLYIDNQSGAFYSPANLDFTQNPNQQVRVDILTSSADVFSVAAGDVLLNAYQTQSGDPATSGYSSYSVDMTALANAHLGETLMLRFAETDNQFFFHAGVDAVAIDDVSAAPEPGSMVLFGAGLIALIGWGRRFRLPILNQ